MTHNYQQCIKPTFPNIKVSFVPPTNFSSWQSAKKKIKKYIDDHLCFFNFHPLCLHRFIVPVLMLLAVQPASNVSYCLDWSDA